MIKASSCASTDDQCLACSVLVLMHRIESYLNCCRLWADSSKLSSGRWQPVWSAGSLFWFACIISCSNSTGIWSVSTFAVWSANTFIWSIHTRLWGISIIFWAACCCGKFSCASIWTVCRSYQSASFGFWSVSSSIWPVCARIWSLWAVFCSSLNWCSHK